jgi:RNA polymerase sigma factor (sigma-70 family)
MVMQDLIKLIRTHRLTGRATENLRLTEEIFHAIQSDLRLFVFSRVRPQSAEDVLQEVLKAVTTSLKNFRGGTDKEFWAWCYRIARNKLNDHYRAQADDRSQPLPPEELCQLVDASTQDTVFTAEGRHDLEYVMNLLANSKPECGEYLWKHFVFGLTYGEIAEENNLNYDTVRMKVGRCLDEVRRLLHDNLS